MSNQIKPVYFGLHMAKQFHESVSEAANSTYYVFAGRPAPYSNNDVVLPPDNNVTNVDYDVYDTMVFGKRVTPTDVALMIPRYEWNEGATFESYRDNIDLTGKRYFCCVNAVAQYHVFKVIDNNGGAPSTIQPAIEQTAADDKFYQTSDGYVWKYMFTVPKATFDKFATPDAMPVVPNANVSAAAVDGAVDHIEVTYGGTQYNGVVDGTFNAGDIETGNNPKWYVIADDSASVNGYYTGSALYIVSGTGEGQLRKIANSFVTATKKIVEVESAFTVKPQNASVYQVTPHVVITGDGTGAVARAIVNTSSSNSISRVEMVSRGSGYTWTTCSVVGARDGGIDNAIVRAVSSPKGGHGKDAASELQGTMVGVSVAFANTEANTIPTANDFRSIGIIKDPLFSSVTLNYANSTGFFAVGGTVSQPATGAYGTVRDTSLSFVEVVNASGVFVAGYDITTTTANVTSNAVVTSVLNNGVAKGFTTFDQRTRTTYSLDGGGAVGDFIEDEVLTGSSGATAMFHAADDQHIYMTGLRGTITGGQSVVGGTSGAEAILLVSAAPDVVRGSGEVLYIENVHPIARSDKQTETVKVVLKF